MSDEALRGGDDSTGAAPAEVTDDEPVSALGDDALRSGLAQVERKPPLYRAFRWSLYAIYLALAAWLVGSITVAVWASVYGDAGEALRRSEGGAALRPGSE